VKRTVVARAAAARAAVARAAVRTAGARAVVERAVDLAAVGWAVEREAAATRGCFLRTLPCSNGRFSSWKSLRLMRARIRTPSRRTDRDWTMRLRRAPACRSCPRRC